jgi:diguanylate cyclase (GGDEF)-like protein/PAS domain S-box-containing protein
MPAVAKSAAIPILGGDIPVLRRKWRAARSPGRALPPYEDVVLGSLGRLSDHLVLVAGDQPANYKVMQAGRGVQEWIGFDIRDRHIADLPPNCALSISEAISQALRAHEPTFSVAHRVRAGEVETYEILALPMACRWGQPVIGAYIKEKDVRYSLIDAIFQSTTEGMLALAAVRDAHNKAVDFQIVALNEAAAQLLGQPESALLWRRFSELPGGLNAADVMQRLLATLEAGTNSQFELTINVDDNDLHLKVGISSTGGLLSVTLTDIGDLKLRENSFRLLFNGNPVPMWLYEPASLKFISVNDAAIAHYGYSQDQFLSMSLPDIWPVEEREQHREIARSVATEYHSDRTWRHVRSDRSEIEVLTYARRIKFAEREAVLVAIVDVTERKQAEARIQHMAHHDALTGLPNRILFHQRLGEALTRIARSGGKLAVLCLDLDQFKGVNDTLGHPIGDRLLKVVAERLNSCVQESDLVARLGGDEFAIIMPEIDSPRGAETLANRVIEELGSAFEIDGHEVIVGASVGIAIAPGDGNAADVLLRNADMALYRAKADGRGRFHFFEAEMDKRVQLRRALELDLRKAFNQGEFELYYQPLINLRGGDVSGFEALLRWRHPERGMISPAEFIPLAEEIGLINPLGEWVLREACADAMTWPKPVKVAVNLSPVQFKSRNLVQAVLTALAYSRLPPERLELEITESVLLDETDTNLATLHRLRELGVCISMDDFGTGYSSLSYLRSFPFDKIKIDQSFVRELTERPDCMAIVRAVTGLGASLGIATTAEGVETHEQLDRLRAEGCTEVQGYLFSAPRPATEVAGMLKKAEAPIANVA